jgi:putative transposase
VIYADHRIYRYLLRELVVNRPNQVWSANITCNPVRRGFLHLVTVRTGPREGAGLAYVEHDARAFCVEALQGSLARSGRPEIFNTDLGSQLSSATSAMC